MEKRVHRINKSMSECDLVFAFTDLHELHKWRLDYETEREFGVKDLALYGFWDDNHLRVMGQIFADKIDKQFSFVCSIYDKDGDVIESTENESYGGSGFVTHAIKPDSFFNGFPFMFSIYGVKKSQAKEIHIAISE